MAKVKMEMLCKQCKNPQPMDADKSNENWAVFTTGTKCECGGEYVLHLDGESVR